jgi:hypothetical protein
MFLESSCRGLPGARAQALPRPNVVILKNIFAEKNEEKMAIF